MRLEQFVANSQLPMTWDCITDFNLQFYSNLLKVVNRDIQCPKCLRYHTAVLDISDAISWRTTPAAPGAFVSATGDYLPVHYQCHFCRTIWYYRYPIQNYNTSYAGQLTSP